jgi:transposase
MNLHANAALSWTGRRRLCELVVDQGWTVAAAAASARVSVRCARKWVGRYRLEGVAGLRDRSSAPRCVANRTAPDRVEAIIKLRRLRFTAAEIAETLGMGLSTVSGSLTRVGLGKLGRIGLEPPVRYERSRPGELVHIDVKKLGRIVGGAGKRIGGKGHSPYNPEYTDLAGSLQDRRMGVCARRGRRLQPHRLRRGPEGRADSDSDRLSATSDRFLPPARHRGRACAHRQRLLLPSRPPRARLPPTGHPPPSHPPLPAPDKRKGRTLHPHLAPRMGLRRDLPIKHRTNASP